MKAEIKHAVDDAGDMYADVINSLQKMSKHVRDDAGDALSKSTAALMTSALDLAEQAKPQSQNALKKVGEEVKEHPAATAAVVAAAGGLIGLALARPPGAEHLGCRAGDPGRSPARARRRQSQTSILPSSPMVAPTSPGRIISLCALPDGIIG